MSAPERTPPARPALLILLVAAVLAVAALTLTPEGRGWAWGSPADELVWYASGLGSEATMLQLAGNVGLLVVPAALAVLLWPGLGRPARLVGAAVATGAGIEVLQLTLSLGRVVSPLDAALNASGAVLAGLLVASADRLARAIPTA
jgi:glycopeptide antibiotics resistance protein